MEHDLPVVWFVAPNPGPLTLDGTRCYAAGVERIVLVDPGPAIPGQIERLDALVADRPVESICLTHAHADHAGIADLAAKHFAAPLVASAETLGRLDLPGRVVDGGDSISVDGGAAWLRTIRTPGHSADHLAYLVEPGRAVFTGDFVLGVGSSAILYPDGDVGSCLASFSRVLSLHPGRLFPGHGPPVEDGEARLKHYRDHRIERHTQVGLAVHSGVRTVEELRQLVYGDLDVELQRAAEASIRAHVVHMREQGEEVSAIAGLDDVSLAPEEA